jgi:hypothetical protein
MKFLMSFLVALMLCVPAVASVNVHSNGTNLGPAQDINIVGASTTGTNTPVKTVNINTVTSNMTVAGSIDATGVISGDSSIVVDGSLYVGYVQVGSGASSAKFAGVATVDPCPTLGAGSIFINSSGVPCFCNKYGVDLSLYNGTTACF